MTATKTYYDTLDEAYEDLVVPLSNYARSHLGRQDEAIDAAHDAFVKAALYLKKNPKKKISRFVLYRETIRACRRRNKKTSLELPHDFTSSNLEQSNTRSNEH